MKSPNAAGQTAIRVLGKDVVGSLQHHAVDGPHELSSLDVTVELQHDEQRIAAA